MKIKPSEKKGGEKRARKEERRVEEDKQGGQRGQLFFFCFFSFLFMTPYSIVQTHPQETLIGQGRTQRHLGDL